MERTIEQISNIFDPASIPAAMIRDLSGLVLWICLGIFLVTQGALLWAIVRYRARPGDESREPPQVYGSNQLETAWTIVPMIIVLVLFLVTARTIGEVEGRKPGPEALQVELIGHQWWWEIRYPGLGVVTANELHVPVSSATAPRPTFLNLRSSDVIHSFWVPQLAGKTDVVPNHKNQMWIEPERTGTFLGQCAEYCGTQHARMLLRVVVHEPAGFETWIAAQRAPAGRLAKGTEAAKGRDAFMRLACVSCHSLNGTNGDGRFGPDLSHLMSRTTIAAGAAVNTPETLRAWVRDPQTIKPGCNMPDMKLSEQEVDQITAYLLTLG